MNWSTNTEPGAATAETSSSSLIFPSAPKYLKRVTLKFCVKMSGLS
jgi:hypothetical protein